MMNMAKRNSVESTHQTGNVLMYSQSVNTTASYLDAASLEQISRRVVHISSGDMDFDCIYHGHTTIHICTVDEQNHGGDLDTSCQSPIQPQADRTSMVSDQSVSPKPAS